MARYIDADKFIERIKASPAFPNMGFDGCFLRNVVIDLLDNMPTADVVEVVRCKDCVWWEPHVYGSTIGRCENPRNGLANEYSEDDDFCSYVERKEKT